MRYAYDALGRLVAENDRNGNTRTYAYDADGRLTSATDPLGNTTTYTYDAAGNLLTQTAPLDRVNTYTYDEMGRRVTTTDPMGHMVTFYYDDLGRITGYSNKDGTTVGYTYDANGNRLTVTDELGNVTRYTYDATNRLTSVTDPLGGKTSYAYDRVGNLISTTDALGNVTSQTYDKLGNLTSQTDALGNTTAYAYDKLGRCTSITDPNGGVTAAQYDAAGNIVKITDPEGNVTTYTYNARNELVSYTDAEGFTFSYTYDGNGNVLTYTDGNGNVTSYTYDGLDRATQRTDAAGNIATNEYDAAGRLIKAVNEEGAVTTYTYDADDRLLSMTDALGHVTSFEYDSMDRVTKVTDALGNATTYTYDALGRVATATNAKGVTTTYTYDALGNRLTATDAAGTVRYAYDALGRVTSVTDRNGNTQAFAYDAKGQIVKVTDKNGNETKYTYDPNGNILKTTDALGTDVLFEYNANGQLVKMTQNRVDGIHEQAETLVTLYEYDGRNLVTKVVRADSQELYTYDGNGNMVSKTDGDGYVTEYSYNSLDLVSNINYNGTKEVSYQYNKVGELVKMDDWLGTTAFEVDLLGQLTKMTDHKGNVVSYEYDAVGNQTSVTYPDETVVTKTYDNTYNLTKVHDAENKDYLYEYDDAGRVTKLTYPNGWVEDYTYDAEGNLLKTVDTDPFHNNKRSTKFEYRYDAEGNLISEYKRDTTAGNKALTTTYAYDALNRLVSAHEEGVGLNTTRTYDYDTLGNLIRQEEDGCIEYKYNGYTLDETTKCGTIPNSIGTSYWEYTYDKRGNLISNDKYTRTTSGMAWQNEESFVYDETGRMVQGKNEQGEVSLYTYNGLGIRVGRELIMKDNTHGYTDFHSQTPSVDTDIDKPEVVKESYVIDYTSPTFNTLVMDEEGGFDYRWVYGLSKLSVKITSEGTNWWGQNVTTDILKDYTHQDRLGSTVNLSDQFGRVVGRADYNEWGEITYREALSISSSYRRIYPQLNYTGYDWDDVLGMYYAKARFYSADDKRFVAMDPIKGSVVDPLSLVSYLYCVDNPLRWVDPLGLYYIYRFTDENGNQYYQFSAYSKFWGIVSSLLPADIQSSWECVWGGGTVVASSTDVTLSNLEIFKIEHATEINLIKAGLPAVPIIGPELAVLVEGVDKLSTLVDVITSVPEIWEIADQDKILETIMQDANINYTKNYNSGFVNQIESASVFINHENVNWLFANQSLLGQFTPYEIGKAAYNNDTLSYTYTKAYNNVYEQIYGVLYQYFGETYGGTPIYTPDGNLMYIYPSVEITSQIVEQIKAISTATATAYMEQLGENYRIVIEYFQKLFCLNANEGTTSSHEFRSDTSPHIDQTCFYKCEGEF